jgi:L-alanine-DL-glutamate epimerase-like enolase superfamily enzyme
VSGWPEGREAERVTVAQTWLLRFPYHREAAEGSRQAVDLIGVEVRTSGGAAGMGFTYSLNGGGRAVRSLIDECLLPAAIGRSLEDRWQLWDELAWSTRRMGPGVTRLALSALDIALWDAAARASQVPLHALLGNRRDRVPLFASGRFSAALSAGDLVANAVQEVSAGARAVKLRIGGRPPAEDITRVRAVREAVGDAELMVDAAELLSFAEASWLCPRLEALGVTCLEEPLAAEHIRQYQELRLRTSMAIAGGEHLYTRAQVLEYLRAEAVDVLNPDVAIVGGITEFMRICELADAFGCRIAPHLVADLHVAIAPAIPGLLHVENFPFTQHLWEGGSIPGVCGGAAAPARTDPGHGLSLSQGYRRDLELGASHG